MERDEILTALRAHEPELKAAGVLSASLFGSAARGDAAPGSDIDIAVRVADTFSSGGFDYFYRLEQLERHLSQLLGRAVDVVTEPHRKERFRCEIDKDRVLAF